MLNYWGRTLRIRTNSPNSRPRTHAIAVPRECLGPFSRARTHRWIGTEVRIFAYLQNTILVVCFMGLGMGCLTCRKPIRCKYPVAAVGDLAVDGHTPSPGRGWARSSEMLSVLGDFLIWANIENVSRLNQGSSSSFGLSLTFMLMVLVWDIFVPVGRLLGRLLDDHPSTIGPTR